MTSEQLNALEMVADRPLTAEEIAAIEPLLVDRNDVEIAAVINDGRPDITVSVAVEDVFDVLYSTGDYVIVKTAQLQGNADAVMAFGFLLDAKTIGPGKVNLTAPLTVGMFDRLEAAGLLSATGRAALLARAKSKADPVHFNTVSDALNAAEGRLVL